MLHFYLQKGIQPGDILSLPPVEKLFYLASMNLYMEDQKRALEGR